VAREVQNRVLDLIEQAVGTQLVRETCPEWLRRPGPSECGDLWATIRAIFRDLTGSDLPDKMPPRERRSIDAVLVGADGRWAIVEVDEVQHFTPPRAQTLVHYTPATETAFDRGVWAERSRAEPYCAAEVGDAPSDALRVARLPTMRLWVRRHGGLALGLVLAVATILGAVGWVLPGLRDWLLDHGGWGWTAAVLVAMLAALVWVLGDRALMQSEQHVDEAKAETDPARSEEVRRLKEAVKDLERRLYPTERDKQQFQELMDAWPWDEGFLPWLNHGFNARRWTSTDTDALFAFVENWRERFFDDPVMPNAYKEFLATLSALTTWMALNGFAETVSASSPDGDRSTIYTVPDGNERPGGWPEFTALRDEALALATRIFELRRPLEETGRARGL
jgi:hypothetical protein